MHATRRSACTGSALLLAAAILAGTTGCSSTPSGAASGSVAAQGQHLAPAQFAALAGRPATVVLDVRTPAEFATGHLPNAQNIDVESSDFAAQVAGLDKNATYALYCHSGRRSGIALEQMQAAGFTDVADLAGGITDWAAQGHDVVTGP